MVRALNVTVGCLAVVGVKTNPQRLLKIIQKIIKKGKLIMVNLNTHIESNKGLKVVHGTMEIANQMYTLTEGLKRYNVDAKSVNYYPSYLNYKSDFIFNLSAFNISEADKLTKELATLLIRENDVFHFHFGTSLTIDYSDLKVLKNLNKKVFMHHWGSDVRLFSKAVIKNPYVKVKNSDEKGIIQRLTFLGNYIENCIVSDFELYEYVKDFYKNIYLIKQAIDIEQYQANFKPKNDKLCIVHAPTSAGIKGTSYVIKVIEELKDKYDFDFKLVQGKSHLEAKKIYEMADIIIDQLLTGTYGLLAIEAMAMGKVVICWISEDMKDNYSNELPIISANPDTLKEKLEHIIKNKDMLEEVGKRSRRFVEKYHNSEMIVKELLKLYSTEI
ncbi:MAG: glycosyltransferase [Sedimentibacter sp.]